MPSGEKIPPTYARIAVNVPHVQGEFDYHLPEFIQDQVSLGHLVTVPFGAQTVQGIIIGFPSIPEVPKTKAVSSLLDPIPVVTPKQIQLAEKISYDTLSPLGITIHAMLSNNATLGGRTVRHAARAKGNDDKAIRHRRCGNRHARTLTGHENAVAVGQRQFAKNGAAHHPQIIRVRQCRTATVNFNITSGPQA